MVGRRMRSVTRRHWRGELCLALEQAGVVVVVVVLCLAPRARNLLLC